MVKQYLDIISQVFLVNLFVEGTVLTADDLLSLLVKVLNLIPDSVMNTFIKDSKNIVLFPNIYMDILKIFFGLEQLPVI